MRLSPLNHNMLHTDTIADEFDERLNLSDAFIGLLADAESAPGTLLVHDTFVDTNGTDLTAHTIDTVNLPGTSWIDTGLITIEIQSNEADSTGANSLYTVDGEENKLTVEALTRNAGVTIFGVDVAIRIVDRDNKFVAQRIDIFGTKTLDLIEVVAGTPTNRATVSISSAISVQKTIKLVDTGTTLQASIVEDAESTVPSPFSSTLFASSTLAGIGADNIQGSAAFWDDFKVTKT